VEIKGEEADLFEYLLRIQGKKEFEFGIVFKTEEVITVSI
jgi:hypothetical protein